MPAMYCGSIPCPKRVGHGHATPRKFRWFIAYTAHFSRLELPISDYVTDLKSILDQSIRIIQAMIDICANSGWLSSTINCMHLLQMVMQGLWFGKDSSLWMLPCMSIDLLSFLNRNGIVSVQDLLRLPNRKLHMLLKPVSSSGLYQELQNFPHIQVKSKLEKRDAERTTPPVLNIRLEKINFKHSTPRAFVPRFPKVKDEAWWLILGNVSNSELYALKRVSFSDRMVTRMNLPSTPINFQDTKLILVSDCYLGFDQEHSIEELT